MWGLLSPSTPSSSEACAADLRRRRRNNLKQLYRGNTSALERSNLAGKTGLNHTIDDVSREFLGTDHAASQKDIVALEAAERQALRGWFTEKDLWQQDMMMATRRPTPFDTVYVHSSFIAPNPLFEPTGLSGEASPCTTCSSNTSVSPTVYKSALRSANSSDLSSRKKAVGDNKAAATGEGDGAVEHGTALLRRTVSFDPSVEGGLDMLVQVAAPAEPCRRHTYPVEHFNCARSSGDGDGEGDEVDTDTIPSSWPRGSKTPPASPHTRPGGEHRPMNTSEGPGTDAVGGDDSFVDMLMYVLQVPQYLLPNSFLF